ncbi:glycosyltransferase [Pedobacter yulinensis]|nr:glycosyltransferase [Pedobacter yulinensis]
MKSVHILMATYQGERYIENQILSLIGQTYTNWTLFIHDDGSVDNTMQIVRRYAAIEKRIVIIDDGIKLGQAAANFLHMLPYATADLILFCDQDDIWFESKIQCLVEAFDGVSTPQAAFCNGYAYSAERGIISDNITKTSPKSLNEQLFLNAGIQGCSMMFNKQLLDKLHQMPAEVAMHDHLITLLAISFGKLVYVNKSLMLYRQSHVGKATEDIQTDRYKRLKSIFISDIPVIDQKHFNATKAFYESFGEQLSEAQHNLFKGYFSYASSKSLVSRLSIVLKYQFKLYNSVFLLVLKTITRKPIK